ncbi:MAG TPA: hypothetical protein VG826_06055 [Pirellulales bacterium]|nr:hypothetical protein [Pirellulales bacterium]
MALVERLVSPGRPARRIVHIADFHLISRADYGTFLRQDDPDISETKVEEEFQKLKATVRGVQANQLRLIRWLAKEHDVRVVYLEGLTENDKDAYANMVRLVREGELDYGLIGAAGQALIAGDIEVVSPAEEQAPYRAVNPLASEGLKVEGPENDAREEAIVRRLAAKGPLSVVVLGLEHDLSRHVQKLGDCEYLKVYVEGLED